jgi:hypothetical protein
MKINHKFLKHFVSGFLSAFKFANNPKIPAKSSDEAISELWYKIGKYVNTAEKQLYKTDEIANDNEQNY